MGPLGKTGLEQRGRRLMSAELSADGGYDDVSRQIVDLISRGEARSRSQLATHLAMAPSTIGIKVQSLVDAEILRERGEGVSRGGRRPRLLEINGDAGVVLTVDIGGSHARVGLHSLDGTLLDSRSLPVDLANGPIATLEVISGLLDELASQSVVRMIGIGLLGPVDTSLGGVTQPSRMPGWADFPVGAHMHKRHGVAVVVENDANLAALGEHRARFGEYGHSITVKAGTAIGSGIIVDGRVYRGATSGAGDIGHSPVPDAGDFGCSCGNTGCLETVASGASLVRQLREGGRDTVETTADVLELVHDGDIEATTLVRSAGTHLGQVLASNVNFLNPHAVFLTGSLSASVPFLAAARSRVYEACNPLATQQLRIEAAQTGADAVLLGAARYALDSMELPRIA